MDNYTLERQASKKFYNKCSENSRSQIVFRTYIFRKLMLGAPGRSHTSRSSSKVPGGAVGLEGLVLLKSNPDTWIFTSFVVGPVLWSAPLSRSALHSFASLQKSRRNHRSCVWTLALSSIVFVPAQKLSWIVRKKPQLTIPSFLLNKSLPWVPEVFLACRGNFRCWPKPREKTGNRARKSLWHPGW